MKSLEKYSPPLPTPEEMRQWDATAVALGLPELLLMENASRTALAVLKEEVGSVRGKHVLLFMGPGNNGGDAACLARHLLDAGAHPFVLHTRPLSTMKGTAGKHVRLAKTWQVPFFFLSSKAINNFPDSQQFLGLPQPWQRPDIIVDGLLGTGFDGTLRQPLLALIAHINKLRESSFVLSLDVPSGLNSLTGKAMPVAVRAHATVCFAAAKPGLVLPEALSLTGRLYIRSIGIPQIAQKAVPASFRLLTGQCAAPLLPPPTAEAYKNAFGHVLVVGASPGLTGAAHLAALAALRSGAGLVSAACPPALCPEVKAHMPDIMTVPLGPAHSALWPAHMDHKLQNAVEKATAMVLGPGMGTSAEAASMLGELLALAQRPPAVLDADALNLLAQHTELLTLLREDDILTPHPGEAARLLGSTAAEVQEDRPAALRQLNKLTPCCIVLKGAGSLLGNNSGPIMILPYDIPSLAVAGSGDVLAGCAGALLGKGLKSPAALALATCAHLRAGQLALEKYPLRGNTATELAHFLPTAFATLTLLPEVHSADH